MSKVDMRWILCLQVDDVYYAYQPDGEWKRVRRYDPFYAETFYREALIEKRSQVFAEVNMAVELMQSLNRKLPAPYRYDIESRVTRTVSRLVSLDQGGGVDWEKTKRCLLGEFHAGT